MEIRVLEYFMEIAREGSMTRAAETLHVSQPTLSKEMKKLEQELGTKLFRRSSASVHLTDEGMLLRKRAEDILGMVEKTTAEFKAMEEIQGGEVFIGCAESYLIRHLAQIIKDFRSKYPLFQFHLTSGNTEQVIERLDRGLLDYAFIVEPPDLTRYNFIEVPGSDTVGLLLNRRHSLAQKKALVLEDLYEIDLIASKQSMEHDLPRWCGENIDKINLIGTTNLSKNGAFFVKEGLGALLTFEHLITPDSDVVFIPLQPVLEAKMYVIWKKYQVFSPIASLLLEDMKKALTVRSSLT
ncbi:MAG: LysR family transcriptional regulator [Eubacteriales bacterium]|nr:LysR family transcriptional regulator [Eubacteriales bacterium]